MELVKQALEKARLELLDMGLRGNALLHFRPSAKTIEVKDEIAQEVLRLLVHEKRTFTFAPLPVALLPEFSVLPDDASPPAAPPLEDQLAELYGASRHSDTKLQTALSMDHLDRRLLKIHTDANTFYQEQGIDVLYLALSFLVWFEKDKPATPRCAPLLLVPVTLSRSSARERFALRYTDADLGPNLTLQAKLKMEFHIELPDFDDEVDVQSYCDAVRASIASQKEWRVEQNQIALGFFSFGKFRMYQDLATENWPPHLSPDRHPILQGLLGSGFTSARATPPTPPLTQLNFVKDADSSQTAAVLAVQTGEHLVIQGPPGTGKSQTITNIIADSLASGKTVLFVAEKMAALEVVKRRLDECHLGTAVLELHSHKSNKRLVLEELQRTLELGAPVVRDATALLQRHQQLEQQLNEYCAAINRPILNSGYSVADAIGWQSESHVDQLPPLNCSAFLHWNSNQFDHTCAALQGLASHLQTMGTPAHNAFADSLLSEFSPAAEAELRRSLAETKPLIAPCIALGEALAQALQIAAPECFDDQQQLLRTAQFLANKPDLSGLQWRAKSWFEQKSLIAELLDKQQQTITINSRHSQQLLETAWQTDLQTTRDVWANLGHRWWRFLASDFRRARRTLKQIYRGTSPSNTADVLPLLDAVLQVQQLQPSAEQRVLLESLFGDRWQNSDAPLQQTAQWLAQLHQQLDSSELPEQVLTLLEQPMPKVPNTAPFATALAALAPKLDELQNQLQLRKPAHQRRLIQLQQECENWPQQTPALYAIAHYNRLHASLISLGLNDLADMSHSGQVPSKQLVPYFRYSWFTALLNHAYQERKAIAHFERGQHEQAVAEFRELDAQLFGLAQERLAARHFQQLPAGSSGEMEVLRREMNKKRRHLPIRPLLAQAGRAVQKIKPVFMMSPMSVATYLQPGQLEFDLVVFDEASQVRVVDAFGPLLRARQAVVVGDSRQMPPTDFFNKSLELDDDEAEQSATADIESILNMFLARGARESWLRWHYRSRHDSLIQVSNRAFYDNKLLIFPSPGTNPQARGLQFAHLPNTVYERGGSRTNPQEAQAVAAALMAHAKDNPKLTLGVVAFSTAQRDCILLELERLRRDNPAQETFFDEAHSEDFFVKNLENVQGDERDVILISIGYGRTADGNLSRQFGPLNNSGGERRLNVLITRARLAMTVFCNFTAAELPTSADTPAGVRALQEFLQFAERREFAGNSAAATAKPFPAVLAQRLQQQGYGCVTELGSAGCFLDAAVQDQAQPRRFVLAIESDGANYAGPDGSTARDRERLRPQVLAGLGWQIHRIWSPDWLRNADAEWQRLLAVLEQPSHTHPKRTQKPEAAPVVLERDDAVIKADLLVADYQMANGNLGLGAVRSLADVPVLTLSKALARVVKTEGAIHLREATRRITEAAGLSRVTAKATAQVEAAAQLGHQNSLFHLHGDFLYADATRTVVPRNRAQLPAASRQPDLVPPEEWHAAFIEVLTNAMSMSAEALINDALLLLGFSRPSASMRDTVRPLLPTFLATGHGHLEQDQIRLSDSTKRNSTAL